MPQMVQIKLRGGRVSAMRAFHDLLGAIGDVWLLLDSEEQAACGEAIRKSFAPFFHDKLVSDIRETLDAMVDAERRLVEGQPATIVKFHQDRTGKLTIATSEQVSRGEMAERVVAAQQREM